MPWKINFFTSEYLQRYFTSIFFVYLGDIFFLYIWVMVLVGGVFSECQKRDLQIDKMIEQVDLKIDMGNFSRWKKSS